MKCGKCGAEVEVSLEEAGRILGVVGGRVRGGPKRRKLSSARAREMVRSKYNKRHREDMT